MPAPTVSSTTPSTASTNVGINSVIRIQFSTALLSTTVGSTTFVLTHSAAGMIIGVTAKLDPNDSTVVYVTPNSLLYKNTTYTVKIVGADINSPTGALKASDGTALATTYIFSFTTGNDIAVPNNEKTDVLEANEGQLSLPAGVIVGSAARFQLLKSVPADGSWGFTGQTIELRFNRTVEQRTITGAIVLNQLPFLDEIGWFAKPITGALGVPTSDPAFEWEMTTGLNPPTWTMYQSGSSVFFNVREVEANQLKNVNFEITISEDVTDTTGNYLVNDYVIRFTSPSYPSYISPRTIMNEIPSVFDQLRLDYVHQLIWKHSIDAYKLAGWWREQFTGMGRHLQNYVKYSTALDILNDLMAQKTIMAGITKVLGDMTISYHPRAGSLTNSPILDKYKDLINRAEKAIAFRSHTARVFIRGWNSDLEPVNYRTRLWKNPSTEAGSGELGVSDYPVNNTSEQRASILPGPDDSWS